MTPPDPIEIPPAPQVPRPSLLPKGAVAHAIGGVPGTVIAIATALAGLIQAYTGYQDSQAIQRSAYEALKTATDRNTAQLNALTAELNAGRDWMESIERAVRELQRLAAHEGEKPKTEMSGAPTLSLPAPAPTPLPTFDRLKKD